MKYKSLLIIGLLIVLATSCNRRTAKQRTDTMTSGVAKIAIDATCLPFMREEIAMFENLYEEASIIPLYTTDEEAIKLLLSDSLRLIISGRNLTESEKQQLRDNKVLYRANKLATDAVALIVHRSNTDTLITVSSIRQILTGKITQWEALNSKSKLGSIKVVFDNPSSSIVRYLQEEVCDNQPFGENIKAQRSEEDVLDYVSKTPNALGILSASWVSDPTDTLNLSFTDKIRVMSVSPYDEAIESNSYLPQAAWIAMKYYPLTRDIYSITSDVPGKLPSGFMNFIGGDSGQRIILKSGIIPANPPIRLVSMKPE